MLLLDSTIAVPVVVAVVVVDAEIGMTNYFVGVVAVDDNSVVVEVADNVVPMIVVDVAAAAAADAATVPDHSCRYFEMAIVHFPMVVDFPHDTAVPLNYYLAVDTATVERCSSPNQNFCFYHHLSQLE